MPAEESRKTAAAPDNQQPATSRTHAAFAQAEAMRVAVLTLLQCLPAETRERFKTQYGAKMKRLAGSATHRALPQAAIEEFQDSGQQLLEDLAP